MNANIKDTEMLELPDRDLKAGMIKLLQWAIMNMLDTNEKVESLLKEKKV